MRQRCACQSLEKPHLIWEKVSTVNVTQTLVTEAGRESGTWSQRGTIIIKQ